MENKNFAERLSAAMKKADLTQAELSRKTKIGKPAISQYLSGKVIPKQDKAYLLATKLNVSPSWLMGLSNNMYDNDVSPFGSDDEIEKYLEERGRGDLWETYIAIGNNDSLRVLMDGAADLTPEDLEPVLILIQGIRKAKGRE